MKEYKEFELTQDLVTLLRNSYVNDRLSDIETGSAEIDGKRPYGNSNVYQDIAELLDWEFDEDTGLTDEQILDASSLHEQTPKALQVVLGSGNFEPGVYRTSTWYGIDWKKQ